LRTRLNIQLTFSYYLTQSVIALVTSNPQYSLS